MSKKKVILAMPELFKIHELIIENLEKCGFEVLSLTYEEKEFKYKKYISTAEKNLVSKYSWTKRLQKTDHVPRRRRTPQYPVKRTSRTSGLLLHDLAGCYPKDFIAKLRAHSKLMVYYNWEALTFLKEDFDNHRIFRQVLLFRSV